jgi:hypothetical protein
MIDDTINRLIDARRSLLRSIAELDSLLEEAALSAVSHNVGWRAHKGVQESLHTPADAPPKKAVVEKPNPSHVSWRRPVLNLPVIGGHDFTPPPEDIFLSGARAYKSYGRLVYLAGCPGQLALSRALDIWLAKPGCATPGRLRNRMGELSDQGYGAARRVAGGWSGPEAGWDDWDALYLKPAIGPRPGSPVTVERHDLLVRVPATLSKDDFDNAFDRLVRKGALWPWADTPDVRRHCRDRGVDPFRAYRGTLADNPPEAAREICVVSLGAQARDVDRLIAIAEHVVAKHLGLVA